MPLARFWGSTIGKKTVMAVTGIVLVGCILVHVTANLLVFVGPEAIDGYAAKLREFPVVLLGRARSSAGVGSWRSELSSRKEQKAKAFGAASRRLHSVKSRFGRFRVIRVTRVTTLRS